MFYEECNGKKKKTELGLRGIVIYSSVSLRQFIFAPSNNLGSEESTWKMESDSLMKLKKTKPILPCSQFCCWAGLCKKAACNPVDIPFLKMD